MSDNSPVQEVKVDKAKSLFFAFICFWRCGKYFSLFVLLIITLYLSAGRHLLSFVNIYTENIETRLSTLLGEPVRITQLKGDWYRFSPILTLEALEVSFPASVGATQSRSHRLDSLNVEFDVFNSLLRRSVVIKQVTLDELRLELVENSQGEWTLAGLVSSDGNNNDTLIDFLLNTKKIQLVEADLFLERADGTHFELNNIYMQLLNNEQEHFLQAQLRLDGQESLMRFDLNLKGDLRKNYTGQAFASFNSVDFTKVLAQGFAEDLLSQKAFSLMQASSAARIWLGFDQDGMSLVQGNLNNLTIFGEPEETGISVDLSNSSVDFTLSKQADKLWHVWLEDLEFDWHQRPWGASDFFAEIDGRGEALAFDVSTQSIDLQVLSDIVDELSLPGLNEVLADLHPAGQLKNVRFSTDLSGNYPQGFELVANLQEVDVGAWSGAPSGSGINGYVEAHQFSGFVELDSDNFSLHLPKVFDDGWQYDSINARVHWQITEEDVLVNSSIIDVLNEDIHGRVKFDLTNTKTLAGGWDSGLTLLVGVMTFDASKKSAYLPILEEIADTMSWLDQSLLSGDVENSGFIFRGITSSGAPSGSSTVQTFYNINNAELRFLEQWPVLENLSAFVKVDNDKADIVTESADFFGIQLVDTQATIRPNKSQPGAWLSVHGAANTPAQKGLSVLRETPVREAIGAYLDNWQAEGNLAVDINLGIPLSNGSLENLIQIDVVSENTSLNIPDYNLLFESVAGELNYHSEHGLVAEGLRANLFESPVEIAIGKIQEEDTPGTRVTGSGVVSSVALQNWSGQSDFIKNVLGFTQGDIKYESELDIFSKQNEEGYQSVLRLNSTLSDLKMELPEPFAKRLNETRPLSLEIGFAETNEVFTVEFDDVFYGQVLLGEDKLENGQLYFGKLNKDFAIRQAGNIFSTQEQGLLISGELEYFDFEGWQQVADSFINKEDVASDSSMEEIVRLVDLKIERLDVYGAELKSVNVLANRSGESWQVALENEMLGGDFNFPDESGLPYAIDLAYLRFPATDESDIKSAERIVAEDALADIDPSELPDIDFSTVEFSVGDRSLGSWEFSFRSNDNGAIISNISMNMDDAIVTGLDDEPGATMDWQNRNGLHTTGFTGAIIVEDLSRVLPSLGYNAHIQSSSAEFITHLQWPASPVAFSLLLASGQLDINILKGKFVDVESGSARLFGVFNFDSIKRRLQLDFSDIYEKGLAYDKITGKLNLDEGVVHTDGKFLIQGPSSTINLEGELNLRDETINADMLVNLPFSQNIAVVAGVLGAWPVAIGAYVAGKIFKDQLSQFTTVLYHLKGPWSDLSAGFESDAELVENEMEEVGITP